MKFRNMKRNLKKIPFISDRYFFPILRSRIPSASSINNYMEKSSPDNQILVFLTPTSDMNDAGSAQGRLPIGNGQAPGIEIGRGAT
jgi:hypothetical protein